MTPYASLPTPNLASMLTTLIQNASYNLNCHQIGTIVSFDAGTQSAKIQLSVLRQVPDPNSNPPTYVTKAYPLLVDCPVFVPAGGSGRLTFPIEPGDSCLVLFNDRDLDIWWTTGNTQAPNSPRAHSLSDGLALVGFRNKANKIPDYSTTDVELRYKGGVLKINDKVTLNGATMELKTLLTSVVTALTALNSKTGPSAATQITAVTTNIDALLQ